MAYTQSEVTFEETATPNFPAVAEKWAMVWMGGNLVEVPAVAHSYQVPFQRFSSNQELQDQIATVGSMAQSAHANCNDINIVVSIGTGPWAGMTGIHAEGSR